MPTLTLGGHSYTLPANRDCFINPADHSVYAWLINHSPEGDQGTQKQRSITVTANTGNVGLTKQQADDQPLILKRSGTILDATQEEEFWVWYQRCEAQTIYFVEFSGDAYEIQITRYNAVKVGTGGPTRNGKGYYIKWDADYEVYALLAGPLHDAGVVA